MSFALRAWLLWSAAAGLTACASNPPLQAAAIDYRGDAPGGVRAQPQTRPTIMADSGQPIAPPVAAAAPGAAPLVPEADDIAPYQRVADLGPSTGVPAVAEAQAMAAERGSRPGGSHRLPADNPSARAITVLANDTLYDISRRYSVNMRALIETNGLEPPYALTRGDVIYLPPPNVHVVEAGETLYAVSRRYNVDTRSLALLNGMARPWTVWPGDELLLPPLAREQERAQVKPVAAAKVAPAPEPIKPATPKPGAPKPLSKSPAPVASAPAALAADGPIVLASPSPPPAAKAEPKSAPAAAAPAPAARASVPPPEAAAKFTPSDAAGREFIWPVSGKVLKGYGAGPDGQRNDGVNISGAKGADVRAAAGGEVVYAGSELAGFGNLVLIRHPGGWVTAYAHSDSVLVREGDLVKQGQAIATVGSTGNAASPQVHFELRKGKEPVDPSRHLPPLNG